MENGLFIVLVILIAIVDERLYKISKLLKEIKEGLHKEKN